MPYRQKSWKPGPGAAVDWSHPLTAGLRHFWGFTDCGDPYVRDLADPRFTLSWVAQPTDAHKWEACVTGPGANNTYSAYLASSASDTGTYPAGTIALQYAPENAHYGGMVCSRTGLGASGVNTFEFTNNWFFRSWLAYNWRDDGNSYNWSGGPDFIDSGRKPQFMALTVTPERATIWNPDVAGTGNVNWGPTYNDISHPVLTLNGPWYVFTSPYDAGGRLIAGAMEFAGVWARALSLGELASLRVEPYQFLYEPREYWGLNIPAPTPIAPAAASTDDPTVTFRFASQVDASGLPVHFTVQMDAQADAFGSPEVVANSAMDGDFEYDTSVGSDGSGPWSAIGADGLAVANQGRQVRVTRTGLSTGSKSWRVRQESVSQ